MLKTSWTEQLHNNLHKNIHKHIHRHAHKVLHAIHHIHHNLMHFGELLVVSIIWFSGLMFASYNNSYDHMTRSNETEITIALATAIQQWKPLQSQSKVISVRQMDDKIDNKFAPWYCTYWAARISPEFFPYLTGTYTQERKWWGNAVDRCDNAKATWFKVTTEAAEWTLIVFKPWNWISVFGHVAKVLYYNKDTKYMLIREMNRLDKYIVDDRRLDSKNDSIKCYIYPNEQNISSESQVIWEILPIKIGKPDTTTTITNNTTITVVQTPNQNISSGTTTTTPTIPAITKPENLESENQNPAIINPDSSNNNININLDNNLSDIAKHFFNQNKISIQTQWSSNLKVWEKLALIIKINNKETRKPYSGILPFVLNNITSNNIIDWNISTIQLINNWEISTNFVAKQKGNSSITFTIDDQKVSSIPIYIN